MAWTLTGVFLLGIPVLLYVLIAPHLFGTWRRAVAPLVVAVALLAITFALDRLLRGRTVPSAGPRFLILITVGASLGGLWGVVAGHPDKWYSVTSGSMTGLWIATASLLLERSRRRRELRSRTRGEHQHPV